MCTSSCHLTCVRRGAKKQRSGKSWRTLCITGIASIWGPEVLGQQLWAEAKARGWEEADDREVIGNGAPWIWNQAQEHFYDGQQVVDWYHVTEHLATVAKVLHGDALPRHNAGTVRHRRRSIKDMPHASPRIC
jgi:hypothetical protein